MKLTKPVFGFSACILGLAATFLIEAALVQGGGGIDAWALRYLYTAVFSACPIILLVNLVGPIFGSPVFSGPPVSGRLMWMVALLDIGLFQAIAIFGLGDRPDFQSLYLKHFILLQSINLLFLWACVCAMVGQDRFHPFFRDVMRNPLGAIGYWSAYGATQVGRTKKSRSSQG